MPSISSYFNPISSEHHAFLCSKKLSARKQALIWATSILVGICTLGFGSVATFRSLVERFSTDPPKNQSPEYTQSIKEKANSILKEAETGNVSPFVKSVLSAYDTDTGGWIMVPPKENMNTEHKFSVGFGAATYDGGGDWKIHLSIDPEKMKNAIPIVMNILHGVDAPKVGFKLQTRGNLTGSHQIGKEFVIIFDKEAETDLSKGGSIIKNCLQKIINELTRAGIQPEKGTVLTVETEGEVSKTRNSSSLEKGNYNTGKFDRRIPSKTPPSYFYYRDESPTLLIDIPENSWGRGIPGIVYNTDVYKLVKENPDFAHNPLKKKDPYISLILD